MDVNKARAIRPAFAALRPAIAQCAATSRPSEFEKLVVRSALGADWPAGAHVSRPPPFRGRTRRGSLICRRSRDRPVSRDEQCVLHGGHKRGLAASAEQQLRGLGPLRLLQGEGGARLPQRHVAGDEAAAAPEHGDRADEAVPHQR